METNLVLHQKTHHITVTPHPRNTAHLSKETLGNLTLQGGVPAYVKAFIQEHNTDESAHPYIQESISELEGMLDGKQDTISDLETIRSGAALGATAVQPGDLATVATTGDYDDLTNKPTIPSQASDVHALPDTTKYGASLDLNINSSTYVVTAQLKDQDGNALGTAQTIDLPLESVVVNGSYDSANKKVVLTLQNGSTVEFSVADLVAGLQSEITSTNKLSADLVDDTNTTHKFVTASDKSTWNGKQDAISDLATIRSGAAAGATALQPSVAASTYATKEEIADQYTKSNLVPKSPVTFGKAQLTDFYTVVGSPTIEDGVLTNITANDYLSIGTYSGDTPTSIEIGSSFKTSNANVFGNAVIGRLTGADTGIFWGNSSFPGRLCFKHRVSYDNGTTWTAVESKSAALSLNTKYYVKFIISLAEQKLTGYVSTDNINWTSYVANFNSGAILEGLTSIAVGKIFGHNASPLPIYLDYTYIKVNGKYFVPPLSSTIVSVSSMTGATSSTAGASGLVPAPAAGDEAKFLRGDGKWVGSTSAVAWGAISGTLSDQTDLQTAINSVKRNIGELVQSHIPLTDAGLHLLDGSLISGSGSYSAFVTYIAGLVSDYPDLFETEANWQTSVTNYDVCSKFVYDSANNTVRLPKTAGAERYLIYSSSNGSNFCRIYSDGWCEQGNFFTGVTGTQTITLEKPFLDTNYSLSLTESYTGTLGDRRAINNANKTTSSFQIFAGSVSTVGFYWEAKGYVDISAYKMSPLYQYIVIANSTKTEIEVDIDEIATDLNGKANSDLANITNDGKQAIVNSLMPDYENVISVDGVARGVYTQVVKDSFVVTWGIDPYKEDYHAYVSPDNGVTEYIVGRRYDDTNGNTESVSFSFFVPKGWYFTNNVENGYSAKIYPLKGAQ